MLDILQAAGRPRGGSKRRASNCSMEKRAQQQCRRPFQMAALLFVVV
jgi:hypothetical protein